MNFKKCSHRPKAALCGRTASLTSTVKHAFYSFSDTVTRSKETQGRERFDSFDLAMLKPWSEHPWQCSRGFAQDSHQPSPDMVHSAFSLEFDTLLPFFGCDLKSINDSIEAPVRSRCAHETWPYHCFDFPLFEPAATSTAQNDQSLPHSSMKSPIMERTGSTQYGSVCSDSLTLDRSASVGCASYLNSPAIDGLDYTAYYGWPPNQQQTSPNSLVGRNYSRTAVDGMNQQHPTAPFDLHTGCSSESPEFGIATTSQLWMDDLNLPDPALTDTVHNGGQPTLGDDPGPSSRPTPNSQFESASTQRFTNDTNKKRKASHAFSKPSTAAAPAKKAVHEKHLQAIPGYSEFPLSIDAPKKSNSRRGKQLTADEKLTREKGACIYCKLRQQKVSSCALPAEGRMPLTSGRSVGERRMAKHAHAASSGSTKAGAK